MGEAVILMVLGGAVILAVAVKGFSFLQRKVSPVVDVWEGDIVAAIIRFEQSGRSADAVAPQSADVVIRRRADYTEHISFVGGVQSLPSPVMQQVFASSALVNGHQPNFSLPAEDQYEAAMEAQNGGYRFSLPYPVAVQVEENERGHLQWTTL